MNSNKRSTFVFYSNKPGDRASSRRTINRHISKLEKEKRDRRKLAAGATEPALAESDLEAGSHVNERGDVFSRQPQLPLAKSMGASSYYPCVPTSEKPPDAWAACHRYLNDLIWHDNGTLGLDIRKGHERTAAMTRWALSYDLIFHALVAWTLCCLPESQDSKTFVGQRLLYHRGQTLKKLHEQLSKGVVDDVLIQGVGLLIPIDDHLGYTDFTQAHLNGIERMIQRRGGLDKVGSSEPSIGLQLAMMVSISTTKLSINTAPATHSRSLPMDSADTSSLSYPIGPALAPSLAFEVSRLPSGFANLVSKGLLSLEMIAILAEFETWLATLNRLPDDGPEPMAYRFAVPSGLTDLEKHICTALICLTDDLTSMGTFYAALVFRKPLKRTKMLFEDLPNLWFSHGNDHEDVLVWLATVITTPRRPDLAPTEMRKTFYEQLILRNTRLRSWNNVEQILGRFFYPKRRAWAWMESWEDIYRQHSEKTTQVGSSTALVSSTPILACA
ncbi:uncharacterized protein AB675_2049 [Cyphellophora attinorum]|uniref:Uncharacterized protein n=1 Tax=Cyphellophora attinorum TaxID=1664694 RepID=A0A0N1HXH4_9EURO|nr:uncharacterized protein AB675_2049 [Phialophora attinorum]KPI42687.1 hypothetical protein AB675_2049 [Phialophora attinorum]